MRSSFGCVSLPRAFLAFDQLKKNALCWLRCALAAFFRSNLALGPRFCSLGRRFGAPGLDLRGRNGCFFDALACARSCAANMLRLCFGHTKTDVSCTSELSRHKTRATQNRTKIVLTYNVPQRHDSFSRKLVRPSVFRSRAVKCYRARVGGKEYLNVGRGAPRFERG